MKISFKEGMNIQEAIQSNKYVKRPLWDQDSAFCYHLAGTGLFKDLVSCDYFTFLDCGFLSFSTSGPDLYAEDLLATDYEFSNMSDDEILKAFNNSKELIEN